MNKVKKLEEELGTASKALEAATAREAAAETERRGVLKDLAEARRAGEESRKALATARDKAA
eukprot:6200754-Pleurochrysis_carterae.AAC.2